jgi:hypothetical protein
MQLKSPTGSGSVNLQAPADAQGTITLPSETGTLVNRNGKGLPAELGFALSDPTTEISPGTALVSFRMPFAMTLTRVQAALNAPSTTTAPTFDINKNGTSILSTKLTIDANEDTSDTAAIPAVISDTDLPLGAKITFDIDQGGTGAKLPTVWLIGTRT